MDAVLNLSELINLIGQSFPVKSLFKYLIVSKQWNTELSKILVTRDLKCLERVKLYCSVFLSLLTDPPKHWLSERLLSLPQTHDILTPAGRDDLYKKYSEVSDYCFEVGPEYGDCFEYDYSDCKQKDECGPICAHCLTPSFLPVMIKKMQDNGCFFFPQFDIICYKCYRKNPLPRCLPQGSQRVSDSSETRPEVLYGLDWSDLTGYIYSNIDCT